MMNSIDLVGSHFPCAATVPERARKLAMAAQVANPPNPALVVLVQDLAVISSSKCWFPL
jgi:hypothetical protein